MSDFVDSEAEETGEELDDTKDQDEQGESSICLESPYDQNYPRKGPPPIYHSPIPYEESSITFLAQCSW